MGSSAVMVYTGFENTTYPDNFFDVVVGNVPFGDYKVFDPKYNKYNFRIHDYFLAKALDQVRPGGMIAVITTKGTLDKANPTIRKYLAERAVPVSYTHLDVYKRQHYESVDRLFERGQTFHNFNDHDYMVLEALSPRTVSYTHLLEKREMGNRH